MNKAGSEHVEKCQRLGIAAPPPRSVEGYIGYQPVKGKWAKDLVAIASRDLIDLTLDQVNRPDKYLVVSPIRHVVSKAFLRGAAPTIVTSDDGIRVTYDALPGDTTYLSVPTWRDEAPQDAIVGLTIEQIEAAIDAH